VARGRLGLTAVGVDSCGGLVRGLRGQLSGCEVECCGMGAAVVPGQDLGEGAGPVRDGVLADLAAGDRQMGDGHGEAADRQLAHLSL
jgi:hypothetical protein